jgi:hypothetical protein
LVYLGSLVAVGGSIVPAMYRVGDADLAPYLTLMWHQAIPGSRMLMANFPWYGPFWLMSLTRWLPDYTALWEVEPWLVSVSAIALVGWSTARVAGRTAAVITLAGLVCAGTFILQLQFAWIHNFAYVNVCVLGAFVVWLVDSGLQASRVRLCLTVAATAAFTAVGVASDKLTLVAGFVPFVVAVLVVACLLHREARIRVLLALGGSVVVSLAGAALISRVMRAAGLVATPNPISLAPLSEIPEHLLLLVKAVVVLFNGAYGPGGLVPGDFWHYACTAAVAMIAAAALGESGALIKRLIAARGALVRRSRGIDDSIGTSSVDTDTWTTTRCVHVAYWLTSACVLGAAFAFSTIPVDIESKRYVVTISYSLVVLAATRAGAVQRLSAGAGVIAAVSVTAAMGIGLLISGQVAAAYSSFPSSQMASSLKRFAQREHASLVYAGYWDAMPLGWFMKGRPGVYPVYSCGDTMCPFVTSTSGFGIDTWYRPRHGAKSLLVLDDGSPPPAAFGKPETRSLQLGGGRRVYVYRYDIAARFSH